MAFDAKDNVIWAGWGNGNVGNIYKISLDASESVTGSSLAFNSCNASCATDIDDGLTYDGGTGTLFLSPDGSRTIWNLSTSGAILASFPWAGTSCYNSGLAIGDQLLFEGGDGCKEVWVVDKSTPQTLDFSFSTGGTRDEGLACDNSTFGQDALWSKDAYTPVAYAFAIPAGSCGVGGEPAVSGEPAVKRTLIYVHGINEPAQTTAAGDFSSVFSRVQNVDFRGFIYYEDQAQAARPATFGACGSGLPVNVLGKAASVGMPISAADATGTPTCDGSSDIGINAIKLDEQIQAAYAATGKPVILVGYSMGGSIIRGMLVYSQLVDDGVANSMIDSVSFIHGVQQGSYLESIAQGASCYTSCGLPGLPASYDPVLAEISKLVRLPLDRPAGQELQDRSAWFQWVNSNSGYLPQIPFFNMYGDIRVVSRVCLILYRFKCHDVGSGTAWGDDVVLRGSDSPTDLSPEGGQKFLNGSAGSQNWEFPQLHRYYWDPLFPVSELSAYYQAFLDAPEQHVNILTEMGQTQVRDCKSGSMVNSDDELVDVLNGRASGSPYHCGW